MKTPLFRALLAGLLVVGGVGCIEQVPAEAPLVCTTPADLAASADVEIGAQDAVLNIDGARFHAWTYGGDVPGPVLRMDVGDTRTIKLVNDSPRPASLHFHGVSYSASDDGSPEHPESIVNPGCAHIYTVTATEPGVWPFHSHLDPRTEMAQGLVGAIVVPDPAELPADHEYVVFLGQLGLEGEGEEEGEGGEEEEESGGPAGIPQPFFMVVNGRPNGDALVIEWDGLAYSMTSGVDAQAQVGDRVRWRVLSVSPDDMHTFHLHGHRWCDRGGVMDVFGNCPAGTLPADNVGLFPAQGISLEYVEDAPGDWMYHCHIVDHVVDGMWAMYHVDP